MYGGCYGRSLRVSSMWDFLAFMHGMVESADGVLYVFGVCGSSSGFGGDV